MYRGAPVNDASEPQAEPSGENPPELLSFAVRFANGHAAERLERPSRGVVPPGSFQEIEAGRGTSSPAPPVSLGWARNVPVGTCPRVGVRQECGMMVWIHQLGSPPTRCSCAPLVARVFESSVPPGRTLGPFFRQLLRKCVAGLGVLPSIMRSWMLRGRALRRPYAQSRPVWKPRR